MIASISKKIRYAAIEKGFYLGGRQAFDVCANCQPVPADVEGFAQENFKSFRVLNKLLEEDSESE